MTTTRKRTRRLFFITAIVLTYPAFVLCYTWWHVSNSDFQGGRNGPLDAYRHTLASSVVAYPLGKPAVDLVTALCESEGRSSNAMDTHNNRIGAGIGLKAKSFSELEPTVRKAVSEGGVGATSSNQVTWLPPSKWRSGLMW